jgi:non-ribosomal peptide synthetase component F
VTCRAIRCSISCAVNTRPDWRRDGLEVRAVDGIVDSSAKFDLYLAAAESAGQLQGRIEYASALFDQAAIENMAAQWCTLLAAIAENPGERISGLSLQSPSERARLLAQSNRVVPDRCDASVTELFAAQAARTPDRSPCVRAQPR